MFHTDVLIIGGGQAGLAISDSLTTHDIDHVVIERGRVGESWRQRWDSLRLLTPNWLSQLPGLPYQGTDPDGFMTRDQVVELLQGYASKLDAPVLEHTEVTSASTDGARWTLRTNRGAFCAPSLVVATGHCQRARVPGFAASLDRGIYQLGVDRYRNPDQLPSGGVLVVGASASGIQLARELALSGRAVTIAVGSHSRLPRSYRGKDILFWLDRLGILDRTIDEMPDPGRAKHEPSLQLVGRASAAEGNLDLAVLAEMGVRIVGRLGSARGTSVTLAPDLPQTVAAADLQLERLLDRIDGHLVAQGLEQHFPATARPQPIEVSPSSPTSLDLRHEGIESVLWATGFRRTYPWLHAPAFDAAGEIRHWRGRGALPGLYVLGLQFQNRRRSSFLGGVGLDAREIGLDIARRSRRLTKVA